MEGTMTKWEYHVQHYHPNPTDSAGNNPVPSTEAIESFLHRLGLEGWELCGPPTMARAGYERFLFKRPYPQKTSEVVPLRPTPADRPPVFRPTPDITAALRKLLSYNVDIAAGRINYRPFDHIQVALAALNSHPVGQVKVRLNGGDDETLCDVISTPEECLDERTILCRTPQDRLLIAVLRLGSWREKLGTVAVDAAGTTVKK
jgi:hypothetical protein